MRDLMLQILLDNAPWLPPDENQTDRPGMPSWMTPNGLLICHPDGGWIFLPAAELMQMWHDDSSLVPASVPIV